MRRYAAPGGPEKGLVQVGSSWNKVIARTPDRSLSSFTYNSLSVASRIFLLQLRDYKFKTNMAPATLQQPNRPIIIGNVAGAMEDCPYAM